jgi:glycosyltransferase involved in cell wall biosynthesis
MKPTISIIIPTLNEEKFIASCLDSVLQQTYPTENMDIMIIDGGSTDKTQEIVGEYHTLYDNIRLIHNHGKIQSIAFNIGVTNSTAPYIIRLDAHVTYDKYYVEKCIDGLKANQNIGNIGGKCIIHPANNTIWAQTNAILNHSKFGIGGASFRVGTEAKEVDSVPFGAFPRKVVEHVGGMREDLRRGEDNEYNSRIRKAGYQVFFDPTIVSTYYSRPTLRTSCQQMFANGESIGNLLYIDKSAIGIRHFIPLLFVLYIIFGGTLSMVSKSILYLYLCGIGLYFICDIVASSYASFKYGIKYFIPLFLMFFCVHISYGLGTIKGIITHTK